MECYTQDTETQYCSLIQAYLKGYEMLDLPLAHGEIVRPCTEKTLHSDSDVDNSRRGDGQQQRRRRLNMKRSWKLIYSPSGCPRIKKGCPRVKKGCPGNRKGCRWIRAINKNVSSRTRKPVHERKVSQEHECVQRVTSNWFLIQVQFYVLGHM